MLPSGVGGVEELRRCSGLGGADGVIRWCRSVGEEAGNLEVLVLLARGVGGCEEEV